MDAWGDVRRGELFRYVDLEAHVRNDHPLRAIRQIVNDALVLLEQDFAVLYSPIGLPSIVSIAPEKLLRAMLRCPHPGVLAGHDAGCGHALCLKLLTFQSA